MRQLALFLVMAVLMAPVARADQNDPALDGLFAELQRPDAAGSADGLTGQIWRRWLDSGDPEVNERLETGMIAMNAGYLQAAEQVFDEVVAAAPDFAEGWNKRATVRFLLGDHAGSIADCARVLALEPRHFGALSGLGLIHATLEDDEEALRWFERALAVNPHMPGVKENISILQKRLRGKAI